MLGHCADSQTVCRPSPRASFFRLWKLSPTGAFALSHEGFGVGILGPSSIWISWEDADMTDFSLAGAAPRADQDRRLVAVGPSLAIAALLIEVNQRRIRIERAGRQENELGAGDHINDPNLQAAVIQHYAAIGCGDIGPRIGLGYWSAGAVQVESGA